MSRLLLLAMLVACGSGSFDRTRLDAIVARVRPLVSDREHAHHFRVDSALDPASLVALPDDEVIGRGDGRGRVRAARDRAGKLVVSIETRDEGHAGEWGFMFAEPGADTRELLGVVLDSQHEEPIGGGWVSWHYDLD
ncbi:MAG TPA: hypothetical protein VGG28_17150 [Kofleriaceae bacterium]|jgi:hypothetical protein